VIDTGEQAGTELTETVMDLLSSGVIENEDAIAVAYGLPLNNFS
jgi:hypothetical protein